MHCTELSSGAEPWPRERPLANCSVCVCFFSTSSPLGFPESQNVLTTPLPLSLSCSATADATEAWLSASSDPTVEAIIAGSQVTQLGFFVMSD